MVLETRRPIADRPKENLSFSSYGDQALVSTRLMEPIQWQRSTPIDGRAPGATLR
jgi:hypothetical protein